MTTFRTTSGKLYTLQHKLGQGGEGTVSTLLEDRHLVAKIYHPQRRTADREAKLQAMIANPPNTAHIANSGSAHTAVAWPKEILYLGDTFVGFTMPKVKEANDLFKLINPRLKQRHFVGFNWQHDHRVARNLAVAVRALHEKGHVMGDLNQKNVLVSGTGLVTLVDCDSYQISSEARTYACQVGVAEYLAPELQGQAMETTVRTQEHDLFSLGVLIFQLLMEGYHPFTGVPVVSTRSLPGKLDLYCIQTGIFPFLPNGEINPPPHAPSFHVLHPELQALFRRCFVDGHSDPTQRPTPVEWAQALETADKGLQRCKRVSRHWHLRTASDCPWCTPEDKAAYQQRLRSGGQKTAVPKDHPWRHGTGPMGVAGPAYQPPAKTRKGGNWFWVAWFAFMFGGEIFSFIADLF